MIPTKSIVLPVLGMIVLVMFNVFAFVRETVFIDEIVVSSFILTTVFIARMRSKTP